MPEQPGPTTSTSRSRKGSGLRYSAACSSDAAEAVAAGPLRHERRVLVAGRDDHVLGGEVAGRRAHDPAGAVGVDALDARAQAHVEGVVARVVLEVGHDLVAGREDARAGRVGAARELREPAARVQAQPVVAPAPRGADGVGRARAPAPARLCAAARPRRPARRARRRSPLFPRCSSDRLLSSVSHDGRRAKVACASGETPKSWRARPWVVLCSTGGHPGGRGAVTRTSGCATRPPCAGMPYRPRGRATGRCRS